jgi:CrcB protein
MKLLVLVSVGGAVGAALRFLTYQLFVGSSLARGGAAFPWATLTVNVAGCFLMGLAVVTILERFGGSPDLRAFVMTGVLGGFTTFSAFSLDVYELFTKDSVETVAVYIAASVILSIAALLAGIALARWTMA